MYKEIADWDCTRCKAENGLKPGKCWNCSTREEVWEENLNELQKEQKKLLEDISKLTDELKIVDTKIANLQSMEIKELPLPEAIISFP